MSKHSAPAFLFLVTCIFCMDLYSQTLRYSISMPYLSLGAYSTKQSDPFAFTNNQGALAQVKAASIGVFGETRFMLKENSVYGFAATLPTNLGNFGLQLSYAGYNVFNENEIGLSYARKLGKLIDLGVQFNYYGYRISQYSNASTVNFELGIILHFSEKFNGGIHVYNPLGGMLGDSKNEKLASAYKLGFGYDVSNNFYVSADIMKEEDLPINVIGGVQYQFLKQFFARVGFMSITGSGFVGLGVGWKDLRLDISGSYHPQLGFSPGILLVVNFKEKHQ